MHDLIEAIETVKNGCVRLIIDERILEFKQMRTGSKEKIFQELCFCVLTANSTAERCIQVQKNIGADFLMLSENDLAQKLKTCGARFHTKRAGYIVASRKHVHELFSVLASLHGEEIRTWLVENIKGFGYKEASHFLRNIGYDDYAIIDFHIVDLLVKHKIIKKPKTLTKNIYLKIEQKLRTIAEKTHMSLAELDLYLWYLETKKILK
ncbi:MAG: N-glycosylase/DNA lyase [Euryarchaeota archaeon]|nr:N-glycosylase/DNA lyase [Euryarchaeota archaeon]